MDRLRTDGGDMDGRTRERNGDSGCRSVSEWERQRQLQQGGSGSGKGSGSASGSVEAVKGLEGAAREAAWWRVGECVATRRQRERRAVAVVDGGSVKVPPDNLDVVGGLSHSNRVRAASKGTAASCFLSLRFSCGGTTDELPSRWIKITLLAAYFCSAS